MIKNVALLTSHKTQQGLTLIELMITVAIISIVAAVAVPAFNETIERNRLMSAVNKFKGDVELTRSEALKSGQDTYFNYVVTGTGVSWCYGLDTGDCDCKTANSCSIGSTESSNNFEITQLSTPGVVDSTGEVIFDFRKGGLASTPTSTATTFVLSTDNFQSTISINTAGRVSATDP